MTPIKAFLIYGLQIWTVDYADFAELVCIAATEQQRDWLVVFLKDAHGVPAVMSDNPITSVRVVWPDSLPDEIRG
jgi:hypothetical protein